MLSNSHGLLVLFFENCGFQTYPCQGPRQQRASTQHCRQWPSTNRKQASRMWQQMPEVSCRHTTWWFIGCDAQQDPRSPPKGERNEKTGYQTVHISKPNISVHACVYIYRQKRIRLFIRGLMKRHFEVPASKDIQARKREKAFEAVRCHGKRM